MHYISCKKLCHTVAFLRQIVIDIDRQISKWPWTIHTAKCINNISCPHITRLARYLAIPRGSETYWSCSRWRHLVLLVTVQILKLFATANRNDRVRPLIEPGVHSLTQAYQQMLSSRSDPFYMRRSCGSS